MPKKVPKHIWAGRGKLLGKCGGFKVFQPTKAQAKVLERERRRIQSGKVKYKKIVL